LGETCYDLDLRRYIENFIYKMVGLKANIMKKQEQCYRREDRTLPLYIYEAHLHIRTDGRACHTATHL